MARSRSSRSQGLIVLATAGVLASASLASARPAFPGAEGFGGTAQTGGLTGDVYRVTSLADTNTPGTLRYGVRESGFPAGGRIIVFDVGGTIQLTSSLDIKNVSRLYIAGQTAPSPVTIVGDSTQITSSSGKTTSNIVVRNLAFRKGGGNGSDAITFAGSGTGTHLILDHVSASWGEDENLSVANNNTNVTVQYTINGEALDPASHAYGSLIRPRINSQVSFHHNLYANNRSRNPRPGTYNGTTLTFDFRNNVIYNFRDRAGYTGGSSEAELENVDLNFVGNYTIAGPATVGSPSTAFSKDKNVNLRAFQQGNRIDSDRALNPGGVPNGIDNGWGMWNFGVGTTGSMTQLAAAVPAAGVVTQAADAAYTQVVNHAGSFWWARDAIDTRLVNNVRTNTGAIVTAPPAADWTALTTAPVVTRPPGWDSDADGMPDAWELAHGLNPAVANNRGDFDSDGYSDLEEYINELAAFPAPAPVEWIGGTSRYARIENWNLPFQPSRFDTVLINAGVAAVDAAGQHGGTLRVASVAGATGRLDVTAGQLTIATALEVGDRGSGQVVQSGGRVVTPAIRLGGSTAGAAGTYALQGGVLDVGTLSRGTVGGTFSFTGGTLHADTVNFDLVNAGGTLAPGNSPGLLRVNGNLTLSSGTLQIELAGTARASTFDAIDVSGVATLGGSLQIQPLGSFVPAPSDSFLVLTASGIDGGFTNANAFGMIPLAGGGAAMRLTQTGTQLVLDQYTRVGDVNRDGGINNQDIAVFVSLLTGGVASGAAGFAADVDGNGVVNNQDIAPFVALLTGGRPLAEVAGDPDFAPLVSLVPEPATLGLLAAAGALALRRGR
jgi:pectate lyase